MGVHINRPPFGSAPKASIERTSSTASREGTLGRQKSPMKGRMRSEPSATRSRTRGQRTATGPIPVMITRSGRCPWRTNQQWRGSSAGRLTFEGASSWDSLARNSHSAPS